MYMATVKVSTRGQVSTAQWIANSSSASNTALTDSITLQKGNYIFAGSYPVTDANLTSAFSHSAGTVNADFESQIFTGGGYSLIAGVLSVLSDSATIYLRSAQSAAVNFSYIDRGFIKFVKVS